MLTYAGRASGGSEGGALPRPEEGHEKTLVLDVEKNVWVETAVATLKVWQHAAKKVAKKTPKL